MRTRSFAQASWLFVTFFLCAGCGGAPPLDPLLVNRPFDLVVPPRYDAGTPTPLVILLHGYTMSGSKTDAYFGMSKAASELNFLYASPDGMEDQGGLRFWNATDGCCNLYQADVDDVAYLRAIIKDTRARYNVDPRRIFLLGHSNGGFMSHRMACDAADEIAAIVSVAGATWKDAGRCQPSAPVSVLEIHGDNDEIIAYGGGTFLNHPKLAKHPSATETVAQAAAKNGCTGMMTDTMSPVDLDTVLPGAETRVERYAGCPRGDVELWTIQGGRHFPNLPASFAQTIFNFLMAHPKP